VADGTTANSFFASYRGLRQVDQVVKTKFLVRNCLRILDQCLGPTRAPSRTNRPLEKSPARWPDSLKGGLDFPSSHARCSSLRVERPLRTIARRVWSRTGRVGIAGFASHSALLVLSPLLVVLQPIEQVPGHGAIRVEADLPSPEAGTCAQHKRPGFLTACDRAEQPPGLAC
jgi:hypothetical protein